MGRIRTIKPEFWTDSFMVQLPPLARLIYISLWSASDDFGCIRDEPERIAMEVMPRENPTEFDDWIQFFEVSGKINRFVNDDGSFYLQIASWESHQKIDRPTKSKLAREGSRKFAIPLNVRRGVAEKYNCPPGGSVVAPCYYCGAEGNVHWHKTSKGQASSWVTFPDLELDHLQAELHGGKNDINNMVLACRSCNRSKGSKDWIRFLHDKNDATEITPLANPREPSRKLALEGKGKEQGKERVDGGGEAQAREIEIIAPQTDREILLTAIGVDPFSGLTGHGGRMIGTRADMQRVTRWSELGLTIEDQCAVIRETMANKRDGPPAGFSYFDKPMAKLAAAKAAPQLEPINLPQRPTGAVNGKSSREQFDIAHREYARRISEGTIDRGPDPSDPFAR